MVSRKNVMMEMSGGPTPVINNSLRGIIENVELSRWNFGDVTASE